jgi:hypothetical protein
MLTQLAGGTLPPSSRLLLARAGGGPTAAAAATGDAAGGASGGSSGRAVSVTSITYERDIYRWSGQETPSKTVSVTVADEVVRGLEEEDLFQFTVGRSAQKPSVKTAGSSNSNASSSSSSNASSNTNASSSISSSSSNGAGGGTNQQQLQLDDPRLSSVCAYWDEPRQSWRDGGVITVGISMSGSYTLCASTHLTSFTSRGQLARDDMELRANLLKFPSSLAIFKQQQSAIVVATLSTILVIFLVLVAVKERLHCTNKRTGHSKRKKNQVVAIVSKSSGGEDRREGGARLSDMEEDDGEVQDEDIRMLYLASGSIGGYGAYWLYSKSAAANQNHHHKRGKFCQPCSRNACPTAVFFLRCYHLYLSLFLAPKAKTVTYPYRLKLLVVCCNLVISGALLALLPCGTNKQECTQSQTLKTSIVISLCMAPFTKVTLQTQA